MRTALLIIAIAGLSACGGEGIGSETRSTSFAGAIKIYEVDGHEYVFIKSGYGGGLAHKADCKAGD